MIPINYRREFYWKYLLDRSLWYLSHSYSEKRVNHVEITSLVLCCSYWAIPTFLSRIEVLWHIETIFLDTWAVAWPGATSVYIREFTFRLPWCSCCPTSVDSPWLCLSSMKSSKAFSWSTAPENVSYTVVVALLFLESCSTPLAWFFVPSVIVLLSFSQDLASKSNFCCYISTAMYHYFLQHRALEYHVSSSFTRYRRIHLYLGAAPSTAPQ